MAVERSSVVAVAALPAMRPPLPATVVASLKSIPSDCTVRLPARALSVPARALSVMALAPKTVATSTLDSARESFDPTATMPPALPWASACWRVSLRASTVTSPSGRLTLSPIVAVTVPAVVEIASEPVAPIRPPALAVALASPLTLFSSPGSSRKADTDSDPAVIWALLPTLADTSPATCVRASDAPTPTAPYDPPSAIAEAAGRYREAT